MKSFLNFISFATIPIFIIGLTSFFSSGNFDDFQQKIIVSTVSFFVIIAFSSVYIYSVFLKEQKKVLQIIFSIAFFLILYLPINLLISYYYFSEKSILTVFFQTILCLSIFLLEILILELFKKNKNNGFLFFTDSILHYIKVVVVFSLSQTFLISLFFLDRIVENGFEFSYLNSIKTLFLGLLFINVWSFVGLFFCNKWHFIKNNSILKVLFSSILAILVFLIFYNSSFSLKFTILIIVVSIVLFSNLFFFLYIRYRDNSKAITQELNKLSNQFVKSQAEYIQLKNQINPHFLFNNINTLITFIELNPNKAIAFAHNLAAVYRHYLQNQEDDFVDLNSELQFIQQYLEIYKAKFESGFNYNIKAIATDFYVLSSSLQELIDNIFKHNVLDDSLPIQINIYTENDYLIIQNTIEEKKIETSDQSGLKNINKRYEILIQKSIETKCESGVFYVKLPILKLQ